MYLRPNANQCKSQHNHMLCEPCHNGPKFACGAAYLNASLNVCSHYSVSHRTSWSVSNSRSNTSF